MRISCLALLLAVLIQAAARAEDLFVNNVHGSDDSDGRMHASQGELGGPVKTLTRALEIARSGDRIVMADSGRPYRESVTLFGGRHSGRPGHPFVISGNGAVLEGSLPVPPKAWEHYRGDVFRFRPPRSAFAQLFLEGPPALRRWLDASSGRLPQLAPREWSLADGMIYFRVDEGKLPADYGLQYAAFTVGVTLYEAHDVLIEDLTVQGFQLDGINAHDCVTNCELVRVISRGNGRAGIAVGGASSVQIEASLVSDNGVAQILADGPSTTAIINTEIDSASAPALVHKTGKVFLDGRAIEGSLNDAPAPPGAQ